MLYRPFILPSSVESPLSAWRSIIEQKTRAAAMTTNQILSRMIGADLISLCQPTMYVYVIEFRRPRCSSPRSSIALIPTLQIHLLDFTSPKGLIQRMGNQHLELCMIVIEELKKTHFGAEILYRIFGKAQQQIRTNRERIISTPIVTRNEVLVSGNPTAIDPLPRIAHVENQSNIDESNTLLTIWDPCAPMMSSEFWDNSE